MNLLKSAATALLLALTTLVCAAPAAAQTVEYVHTDALGSVVAVTDANRNIVERREYEPYGYQLTPTLQNGPGYTGHVQDASTGLTYMQQRYYDPLLGRFLSVDPVTALDNSQLHFNPYAYGYGSPYRFVDPDGRCPMCIGFLIGAVVDITVQVASNVASGQGLGEAFSNVDGTQVLVSGALGSVGQVGGATAARAAVSGLSNGTKGKIGEAVARVGIAARGERVIASQTAAGRVAELGNITGRGARAVPDYVVRGRDGAVKVVEAKFNTAGLTGAQRDLQSQLGAAFTVSRTTMDDVANAGGAAAAGASGASSASVHELRKER